MGIVIICERIQGILCKLFTNRIKKLEFPGISVSVEIPKHLALTSVAMRILHVTQADANKFPSDYLSLGGVLTIELLALPPPPKQVKAIYSAY